jgi:hypothetical protein
MAKALGIPFLGRVPMDPSLSRAGEAGTAVSVFTHLTVQVVILRWLFAGCNVLNKHTVKHTIFHVSADLSSPMYFTQAPNPEPCHSGISKLSLVQGPPRRR